MKSMLTLVGILFIIMGGLSLAYQGFTYTKKEQVAQIGNLQITADTEKKVYFPPILGGLGIAVGLVLVVIGRKNGGGK